MLGLDGFITVAKYWQAWADPRLVFVVYNNQDLNQVTWEMRVEEGNPKLPPHAIDTRLPL
jgi:pyruvate dehydrogenase (quinone)